MNFPGPDRIIRQHCIPYPGKLLYLRYETNIVIKNENDSLYRKEMAELHQTTCLLTLQDGDSGRIASIEGDNQLVRRMLSLGLRVGAIVSMLNHRGKGVVIQNDGTRVALGPGIAEKLFVEPVASSPAEH